MSLLLEIRRARAQFVGLYGKAPGRIQMTRETWHRLLNEDGWFGNPLEPDTVCGMTVEFVEDRQVPEFVVKENYKL